MADLYIYSNKVNNIFQLLGEKENDISYSVGYSLANCPHFLNNFLQYLNITKVELEKIKIKLQTNEKTKGFTDFELILNGRFHLIIEAKKGWNFPTENQLTKYASRLTFNSSEANDKRIIIFNESTPSFTQAHFEMNEVSNFPVEVISWQTIQKLTRTSTKKGKVVENSILNNLNNYLNKISTMQKVDSNWVFVVSLGSDIPDNWKINWQRIVNEKLKYFHPISKGWPAEPPNYIAFRYYGKLQSIHHIDKYEVFTDPNSVMEEIPNQSWEPHYLYHLGEPIVPIKEIKTGNIFPNGRKWAMLDLLLTSETIWDASKKSYERELAGRLDE